MAPYEIRVFGDPVLKQPAKDVTDIDGTLVRLVEDMTVTMYDAPGVGLAAPQVGVQKRLFVYDLQDGLGARVLMNPTIEESEGEWAFEEGCLSIPGLAYDCRRAMRVVAKGFDQHGEPITVEGSELLARAVQHETDHLDGILFIDRLDRDQRKLALKAIREAEWSGQAAPVVKVSPHATFGRAL